MDTQLNDTKHMDILNVCFIEVALCSDAAHVLVGVVVGSGIVIVVTQETHSDNNALGWGSSIRTAWLSGIA